MRYLTFPDREAARARSAREAEARGCGPVTERWWASEADPETGAACLLIEEGDEGGLSAGERASLTDQEPAWLAARRDAQVATAAPAPRPKS